MYIIVNLHVSTLVPAGSVAAQDEISADVVVSSAVEPPAATRLVPAAPAANKLVPAVPAVNRLVPTAVPAVTKLVPGDPVDNNCEPAVIKLEPAAAAVSILEPEAANRLDPAVRRLAFVASVAPKQMK